MNLGRLSRIVGHVSKSHKPEQPKGKLAALVEKIKTALGKKPNA